MAPRSAVTHVTFLGAQLRALRHSRYFLTREGRACAKNEHRTLGEGERGV